MSSISHIKRFLFLTIGCLTYLTSYSQENFIPGLIIKANKDTINGLVDYRDWEKNPDLINFKESIDAIPEFYSPIDIIEFRVKDEIYVSAIILTETSSLKLADLDDTPELNTKLDTTFLQTLIKGKKELYLYRTKERKENFYVKQNGEFELLQYKKYQKLLNGRKSIVENNKYLGQLTLYMDDCPNIQHKLQTISYQENSLHKLFQYYLECSSSDISFQKEESTVTTEFGILAGATLSTMNFESANFP